MWASGGLLLESDETTIHPFKLSTHEAQKPEEGYRWCPRRARHVPDTRAAVAGSHESTLPGCIPLRSSGTFANDYSVTTRVTDTGVGGWRSCFMARLSKIRGKGTNNTALEINADVFSWISWKKRRKFKKYTSPIRTACEIKNRYLKLFVSMKMPKPKLEMLLIIYHHIVTYLMKLEIICYTLQISSATDNFQSGNCRVSMKYLLASTSLSINILDA